MILCDFGEVIVDGKIVEVVTSFIFLGSLITRDGLCDKEIRRRELLWARLQWEAYGKARESSLPQN